MSKPYGSLLLSRFIQRTLTEGRVDDVRKKYMNLPDDIFERLVTWDPSPNKKYLAWIVKNFISATATMTYAGSEDGKRTAARRWENDIKPTIQYFHENQQAFKERDINRYETFDDLENAVKDVSEKQAEKRSRKFDASTGDAVKLFQDDRVLLIRPDSKSAVMKYGAGTRWCITMANSNYYDTYTQRGCLFYFIIRNDVDPKDRMAKVAFAVIPQHNNLYRREYPDAPLDLDVEIFDAPDNKMSEETFYERWKSAGSATNDLIQNLPPAALPLVNMIKSDARSQPKKVEAKMYDGDEVTNDELMSWWKKKFINTKRQNFEAMRLSKEGLDMQHTLITLKLDQQMLIATIEPYVKHCICDGLSAYGRDGKIQLKDLLTFKKDGNSLTWTALRPTRLKATLRDEQRYGYKVVGFDEQNWNDPEQFLSNIEYDYIRPTDETERASRKRSYNAVTDKTEFKIDVPFVYTNDKNERFVMVR